MPVIGTLFCFIVGALILLGTGLMVLRGASFYTWWKIIGIAIGCELVALAFSSGGEIYRLKESVVLSFFIVVLPWTISAWFIWLMFKFFRYPNSNRVLAFVGTPFLYLASVYTFGGAALYFLGY